MTEITQEFVQLKGLTEENEEPSVDVQEKNPEERIRKIRYNNSGVGVVEIILILVVLVALVVIFKEQLTGMVEKAMSALEESMEGILS